MVPAPVVPAPVVPAPVVPAPVDRVVPGPTPAPRGAAVKAILTKAWDAADADPAAAQALFEEAMSKAPANEDAVYGLGYVLLMQGSDAAATPYLCRARAAQDAETRQDAIGMIDSHHLSCP